MRRLDRPQTREAAHAFLLEVGHWTPGDNPYPARLGAPTTQPAFPVGPLPDEPRRDLTHLVALAIDDAGSSDPDDALSLADGVLWVHVADVALGIYGFLNGAIFSVLIAFFIYSAAGQEAGYVRYRRLLQGYTVRHAYSPGAYRLEPATTNVVDSLAQAGVKKLAGVAPSFVSDCLETLEELGMRLREQFIAGGGESLTVAPCLNADPRWVEALAGIVTGSGTND